MNSLDNNRIFKNNINELVNENKLMFDKIHNNLYEINKNFNSINKNTQDKYNEILLENKKLHAIISMQKLSLQVIQQNSIHIRLGKILINGVTSIKNFLNLPFILYKEWRLLSKSVPPDKLGGKSFKKVIECYKDGGFEAVENILNSVNISFIMRADAYTAIARNIKSIDLDKAIQLARIAWEIDPRPYRLKWLAFRLYEANDFINFEAILDILPQDLPMSIWEQNVSKNIRNKSLQRYKKNLNFTTSITTNKNEFPNTELKKDTVYFSKKDQSDAYKINNHYLNFNNFYMEDDVAISVIIPIYNNDRYLRQCLNSVMQQTLKNIEIICIDDGSNDNSLSILEKYQKKDFRIIIIKQNNQGAGISRNKGINLARGKYIAFMDADDYYPDNLTLEKLYHYAVQQNIDICGGSYYKLLKDGTIKKTPTLPEEKFNVFKENKVYDFYKYQHDYGFQRYIYKKEFLTKNNIYFPFYKRYQDPPFLINALTKAKLFYGTTQPSYIYRSQYKEIQWTKEKISGYLMGLLNELNLINHFNLFDLYDIILQRINSLKKIINFELVDDEIYYILLKINSSINISTLNKIKKFNIYGYLISPLRKLYSNDLYIYYSIFNKELIKHSILDYARQYCWINKIKTNYKDDKDDFKHKISLSTFESYENIQINTTNECFFSIIIPAYNVQDTIKRTLDSVIDQNFNDYEIILIDDRSTDNSYNICKEYALNNKHINLYRAISNLGLGSVRNIGIKNAHGKYLMFLDSDDWITPNSLKFSYEIIANNHCDIYIFGMTMYDSINKKETRPYKPLPDKIVKGEQALLDYVFFNERISSACAKLYERKFLDINNIYFADHILYEDSKFLLESYIKSDNILYSSFLMLYIDRADRSSIMRTKHVRYSNFYSSIENINIQMNILNQHNCSDDIVQRRSHYFTEFHHLKNILEYIFYCENNNLKNPIDNYVINILMKNKYILFYILKKISKLYS